MARKIVRFSRIKYIFAVSYSVNSATQSNGPVLGGHYVIARWIVMIRRSD